MWLITIIKNPSKFSVPEKKKERKKKTEKFSKNWLPLEKAEYAG